MPVNMIKCTNCGSFYDAVKSEICPFCKGGKLDKNMTFNVTERLKKDTVPPSAPKPEPQEEEPAPVPAEPVAVASEPVVVAEEPEAVAAEPEPAPAEPAPVPADTEAVEKEPVRTVSLVQKSLGIDPVVGWLVALNGKPRGCSFPLHSDNNFIGRSSNMDVCIEGDETVSSANHAFITYDSRDRIFYLTPGEVRSIVRKNSKPVLQPSELEARDRIEIGSTTLMFIPFCDSSFDWESEGK